MKKLFLTLAISSLSVLSFAATDCGCSYITSTTVGGHVSLNYTVSGNDCCAEVPSQVFVEVYEDSYDDTPSESHIVPGDIAANCC